MGVNRLENPVRIKLSVAETSSGVVDLTEARLPAGAAAEVRAFTREVREADAQPIVLKPAR